MNERIADHKLPENENTRTKTRTNTMTAGDAADMKMDMKMDMKNVACTNNKGMTDTMKVSGTTVKTDATTIIHTKHKEISVKMKMSDATNTVKPATGVMKHTYRIAPSKKECASTTTGATKPAR